MSRIHAGSILGNVRPIFAAIQTVPIPVKAGDLSRQQPPAPFVTISRQAGSGGRSFADLLLHRMNLRDPSERPWTSWDRELVEKVAEDAHVSQTLVDSLEESGRTWLQDFLASLSFTGPDESEARIYQRVAAAIRALAQVGRVVIVGRGGVFITHNMPGGIHIRLVAPLEYRIEHMAKQMALSKDAAAALVRQLDRNREIFYHRYWPQTVLTAEMFHLVLNTALLSEQQLVESVLPLIPVAAKQS